MATSVVCSVVHLSQHPPPVQVPVDRVALPVPIHSQHRPRRTSRENHGGFRWHRPAFQPFQLKPWVKDPDMEEELRESLAVIGPNTMTDMHRFHRSLTAPPATVSSLEKRRGEKKDVAKATHSSLSIHDILNPATKRSVATFPARPPMSRGKQIPGRFFPKPTLTEEQRAQLEFFKMAKPRKASSLHSSSPPHQADSAGERVFDSSDSVSRMDRQHSPSFNQRIARTRQQLHRDRPELRSEVFAICFKQDLDTTAYDPNSELHSDYYSIKRLKMPVVRLGRPVKTNIDDFAVVLRGQRKHLHKKFLLDAGSMESLVESIVQPARSGGSMTRRTLVDGRESPRKVIDVETPKAEGQLDDRSDDASGAEQEQDNTLAPLNSPTDQKDLAFPALN